MSVWEQQTMLKSSAWELTLSCPEPSEYHAGIQHISVGPP